MLGSGSQTSVTFGSVISLLFWIVGLLFSIINGALTFLEQEIVIIIKIRKNEIVFVMKKVCWIL